MAQRHVVKQIGGETYAVAHTETGEPVELNGILQIGLDLEDALKLAEALDLIAEAKDARGTCLQSQRKLEA